MLVVSFKRCVTIQLELLFREAGIRNDFQCLRWTPLCMEGVLSENDVVTTDLAIEFCKILALMATSDASCSPLSTDAIWKEVTE